MSDWQQACWTSKVRQKLYASRSPFDSQGFLFAYLKNECVKHLRVCGNGHNESEVKKALKELSEGVDAYVRERLSFLENAERDTERPQSEAAEELEACQ